MPEHCAYCRTLTNKLTREHIWPKCIIERVPSYNARYSERANKVFSGELTIADVCADCNNGPLSELDSYICDMFDRYFCHFPERGDSVNFVYDWALLGRWLLKISYNSARASGSDDEVLTRFADVILGTDKRPPDLAIFLDLAEPTYYEKPRESGVIEVKKIPPAMTRVCRINMPGPHLKNYVVRLVSINAFYFYLAIPVRPYTGVFPELERIVESFGLMETLDPDETVVRATTTGLTSYMLMRPHFESKSALYDTHFERRKTREEP